MKFLSSIFSSESSLTLRGFRPHGAMVAVALLATGFVALEIGMRAVAKRDPGVEMALRTQDPTAVEVEPHGEFGFRQRAATVFPYPNGTRAVSNARGWRGPLVEVPKPAGTLRVVVLGGSPAHGWGVGEAETMDAQLREQLARRFPDRRVEVVNLAFDAYDSYQLFERFRSDGLALDPDLVVLHTGDVDVANAKWRDLKDADPRTLNWEGTMRRLRAERASGGPSLIARFKHESYATLYLLHQRQRHTQQPTRTPGELGQVAVYDDAIEYFARNLLRTWELAAQQGIPVLFSTPPSGITPDYPRRTARLSYWLGTAEATQRYRERLADRLRELSECLQRERAHVAYARVPLGKDGFLDDVHPNAMGHRIVAEQLTKVATPLLMQRAGEVASAASRPDDSVAPATALATPPAAGVKSCGRSTGSEVLAAINTR